MVVAHGALTSRHGEIPVSQSCVPSHVTLQTVGVGDPPRTIAPGRGGMTEKMATQLNKARHLGRNGTPYPRSGVTVDATAMMEGRSRGLPRLSVEGHLMAGKAKSRAILQKAPSRRESHANDKKEKNPPHHAFSRCDVIMTPTSPTPAFSFGEKTGDPLSMYLSDIYTITANLAGLPALSVPAGVDADGLPVGVHLIGPPWSEGRLLAVAREISRRWPMPLPRVHATHGTLPGRKRGEEK